MFNVYSSFELSCFKMLGKKLESNWICHCDTCFNKPQTEIPSPEQPREIILERHENGESNSYFQVRSSYLNR